MSSVCRVTLILVVGCACCAHGAALSANDRAPLDSRQIEREIKELSADDWKDRRDAMLELMQAGPSAELRLRRLLAETHSPETRIRTERVLLKICSIRRTEPALVTMELKDADAATAFGRLGEIDGAELATDPPTLLQSLKTRANVSLKDVPYWQAAQELCRLYQLDFASDERGLALVPRVAPGTQTPWSVSGIFLVRGALQRWSQDARDPGRSLRLEAFPEPRAQLLRADWRVKLFEAVDQHHQSLMPLAESGINLGGAGQRGTGCVWHIPLRPSTTDAVVSTLRGSVQVVMAEQVKTVQLPDRAGGKTLSGPMPVSISAGGISAGILSVVGGDSGYVMDMQIAIDPSEVDWDGLLISMRSGGIRAFDVDGNPLSLQTFSSEGGGPTNNVRCKWGRGKTPSSPVPGAPYKLIWEAPGKTTQLAVPFELTDVKLIEP